MAETPRYAHLIALLFLGQRSFAGTSAPLNTPLAPGESYFTTFAFDVPADARNPRLLISDVDPGSRLLVDHENSPLHGKIYLALNPSAAATLSGLQ